MIVLLNPVFGCSNNLLSFSADKVTTVTSNLQSVILNAAPAGLLVPPTAGLPPCAATALLYALLVKTQFSDHVKIKDTSQLINGIYNFLQKLLNILMALQFQHFLLFCCYLPIFL